jgi:hypothetical protein
MEGVEEEHREIRPLLKQHVREHDALGLETGGDARRRRGRERLRDDLLR